MLPARSKRYAGIDGDIPRQTLASHWQLFMIALLVVALLVMIFPRKELVEKLYTQETLDELTLSYIENLYRTKTRNDDIAILLVRAQQNQMDLSTLEDKLLPLASHGDARQRTEARLMLVQAYTRALDVSRNKEEKAALTTRVTALMQSTVRDAMPDRVAQSFADLAFDMALPQWSLAYLEKMELPQSPDALEHYAQRALGKGQYGTAAEYFLIARDHATSIEEARRLFMTGINTLMAASLFKQAMQAADQHVGNLSDDAASLRYLSRAALAAGDTHRAARYARALVFPSLALAP
jgi:polysaccharide biosynthesis protein PelB